MSNIGKGLLAGLAATVVLSVLMVMKAMIGIMPARTGGRSRAAASRPFI